MTESEREEALRLERQAVANVKVRCPSLDEDYLAQSGAITIELIRLARQSAAQHSKIGWCGDRGGTPFGPAAWRKIGADGNPMYLTAIPFNDPTAMIAGEWEALYLCTSPPAQPDADLVRDAQRWNMLCNLWGASTILELRQMEDGRWGIFQIEDVEGVGFKPLIGDDPDAAIDAALQSAKPEGKT